VITIGSGASAGRGIGPKAALLDRCAAAGLLVPAGVVVPHEDLWPLRRTAHELAGLGLAPTVAVRSAFAAEDGVTRSLAGAFTTHLDVPGDRPEALLDALTDVVASGDVLDGDAVDRRDVLVLAMVPAVRAGVAFTQRDFEDDLIDHVDGLAADLVAGRVGGTRERLAKRRRFESTLPGWRGRVQDLLRAVRRELGERDWDVEWADDGTRCWLVQVRAVTAPPLRDEALTLANHREILPDLPSRFTTAVVADAAPELFGYWRGFDPSLPAERHFIDVVAGRPVINLSLLTDTMRILGLPTRFVTDSMGGTASAAVAASPIRLATKAPSLIRLGLDQLRAIGNGARAARRIDALAVDLPDDLPATAERFRRIYIELITGMFALTTAISGPLAVLDAIGVAGVLHTRQRTAGTQLWDALEPLRELVRADPSLQRSLAAGRLPDDETFVRAFEVFLARFGHRGIYESDVARPRYREDPTPLLEALAHGRAVGPPPPLPARARLVWPLWFQASRAIAAREDLRSDAMRVFERLRMHLLARAGAHVTAGRLPASHRIFDLDLDEIRALHAGRRFDAAFFAARDDERATLRDYRLPDLIRRSDDLASYRRSAARHDVGAGSGGQRLRGLGLTDGTVTGTAWVVDEPSPVPPALRGTPIVLVTRGVDAGWIGTFSQVDAVVVETGGELSHGSIILRESGTPAVTNVASATSVLADGDRLRVHARAGTVVRLAAGSDDAPST
jgi:rifampicin phosphotransferase